MSKKEVQSISEWVEKVTPSYIRSTLSVSPAQAEAIKKGDYSKHYKLLWWAATAKETLSAGAFSVGDELNKIATEQGIPIRQLAIALALPRAVIVDALEDKPIKYMYAAYIVELANNPSFLKRILERK